MTEITIKLPPDCVNAFLKQTQKCDFNVDVVCNRYEIDGKSLLGVLSVTDLDRPLNIRFEGHSDELETFLHGLAV